MSNQRCHLVQTHSQKETFHILTHKQQIDRKKKRRPCRYTHIHTQEETQSQTNTHRSETNKIRKEKIHLKTIPANLREIPSLTTISQSKRARCVLVKDSNTLRSFTCASLSLLHSSLFREGN